MRILIADKQAILRKGIKEILIEHYPSASVVEVADAATLFKTAIQSEWDLIITDISMPDGAGLETLAAIKKHAPKAPMLVFCQYLEEQYATRALKAGASGYLNKNATVNEVIKAIQLLLLGRKYITPSVAEKLANDLSMTPDGDQHKLLTDREFGIMKQIASGKAIREIAASLSLSRSTISTYRARILGKMGMKTNIDLTKYALHNGMI